LSLICSALTWLRNHKRAQYDASIDASKEGLEGEPDWIVNQMLRRKREEVVRRWEDREAELKKIRAREKALEERGSKRRRVDDGGSKGKQKTVDEEAAFLLDDWTGETGSEEANDKSLLTKETRALLEKVGLGKPKNDNEVAELEDELKVSINSDVSCLVAGSNRG
jgi:chromosome transmission fidelity protein 1